MAGNNLKNKSKSKTGLGNGMNTKQVGQQPGLREDMIKASNLASAQVLTNNYSEERVMSVERKGDSLMATGV